MATQTYTKTGTKATTPAKLNKAVFGVEVKNHELLRHAYVAYLANGRDNLAVTKTRGLVSGGGKKPWKQKGTGRARFGSSRNPIWKGGGIVFGPTGQENYTKRLTTATKRQALKQALTLANTENRIRVIEAFKVKDGKVSTAAALLAKLDVKGHVLLVVDSKDDVLVRATRNIPHITLVTAKYLNVYDIMNAGTVVISNAALEAVNEWLGGNA
jgi:large subunit ribosomal protein L4